MLNSYLYYTMQLRSRVYVLEKIMQLLHQNMKLSDNRRGRSTVKSGWGFSGQLYLRLVEVVAVVALRRQAVAGF